MKRVVPCVVLGLTLFVASPATAATLIFLDCDPSGPCGTIGPSLSFEVNDGVVEGRFVVSAGHSGDQAFGFNILGSEAGLAISNLTPGVVVDGTNETIGMFGNFEYLLSVPGEPVDDPSISYRWRLTISRDIGFWDDMEVFERNTLGYFAAETIVGCCGTSGVFGSALVSGLVDSFSLYRDHRYRRLYPNRRL